MRRVGREHAKQFHAGLVFLSDAPAPDGSATGSGALDTCGASVCEALAIWLLGCWVAPVFVLVRGGRGPSLRRLQDRIDRVLCLVRCGIIAAAPACLCSQAHTPLSRSHHITVAQPSRSHIKASLLKNAKNK